MKMNDEEKKSQIPRLLVNPEGSFSSTGIAPMRGKGKVLRTDAETQEKKRAFVMENVTTPILLVTVQHTASRFFVKIIQEEYGSPWPIHRPDCPFYFDHCRPELMDSIRARHSEGAILVTTQRNWADVEASWERRGVQSMDEYYEQRRLWDEWVEPNAAIILSPVSDDRQERLDNLGILTGKTFDPNDWRPVG